MSSAAGEQVASSRTRPDGLATASIVATVAAYAVLGAALVWSRLFGLGHSFWTDEILMIEGYVRQGPRFILTGASINHELMALLSWDVSSVVGESEVGLRLLSVMPFLAGVVLVTAWLHVRLGALSGVLFLFLATVSPLLLDITRQARGYGLAFLAMSVVVVAALEALQTGRAWLVADRAGRPLDRLSAAAIQTADLVAHPLTLRDRNDGIQRSVDE